MKHKIDFNSENGYCKSENENVVFTSDADCENAFFTMNIEFCRWEDDCFIMMPSCAYNGNRFKKSKRRYPPMYEKEEAGVNCEPLITNVPSLNVDGSGKIEVTSADMSVPCVGIYSREKNESFFLFTQQEIKGKNIGFSVESGRIGISYPANRSYIYKMCRLEEPSGDSGISVNKGEILSSSYKIFELKCSSIAEFYEQFFNLRKSLMSDERASFQYTEKLWNIMENHFNEDNFSGEYYAEISKVWQCGWLGGGISNYPLLKYGNPLSKERALKTIDFMTDKQAPSGFYYSVVENGVIKDDRTKTEGMENLHLIRRSADVLYFLFKNFSLVEAKEHWIKSAKKCADAFVKLFDTYKTFGQFINVETGEMVVGCAFSGALAPAALVKAYEFFGDEKYIDTAKKAIEKYMEKFMQTGLTNGGPCEAMSAPDSESGFALLESCVIMYEADKDEKWLEYAKTMAHYCSSWVVTYSYKFPPESEFARLGINTVGSVYANVQNKHSAPGICTLSGDSLLKLYRYTKNEEYLNLIKDISYFIPQCVSTDEKPIYSRWFDVPEKLKQGYICERVNMSDWETKAHVGEVINFSCWCETSLILSFTELMTQKEMLLK